MFYVISYDITDDKRRNKVAKILESYACRVQYSVFEIICNEEIIDKIASELKNVIKENEDSIRIYSLCNSCVKRVIVFGAGEITKEIEVYVV
ncbi:MAG: CRISPR-associated endonuclease Cas2 [Candidatus Anstonellales archaeon]